MAKAINVRCESTKVHTKSENLFLADARKYPVLTPDEELNIIERIKAGDDSGRAELVNHNLRFIYSLASKFAKGDDVLDLVSLATIGLLNAIDSFDATRGIRFLCFAVYHMRAEISNYFRTDAQLVRIKSEQSIISTANRVGDKFFAENGRFPSEDELIDILNEEYNMAIKERLSVIPHKYKSLDAKIEDDKSEVQEVGAVAMMTASRNDAEISAEREHASSVVNSLLKILPIREQLILKMSFGIGEYEGLEYNDETIAERMGLSRERVRQLKARALAKLNERAVRLKIA